ncbi:MAG: DUF5777 family beta-barrel protein [Chitinophagales bacterium]|nr:DUF5777 family beta-barrel protein [Chitinophagales bacterium]
MNKYIILFAALLLSISVEAQMKNQRYVYETFRGTRIVNGHSIETLHAGEMEMIISHRFGRLNGGGYELFGLDQSTIRLGLDYGVLNWINIGIGRSSLGKEFDGFVKLQLLRQSVQGQNGSPVSITAFSSAAYKTLKSSDPERPLAWQNRLAFTHQVYIARKFSDRFALQLMPTIVHYNLIELASQENDLLALGVAGKYQISKNLALTSEYYYALPSTLPDGRKNVFSLGFDINTGSHVFQLHLTNTDGMIEKQFIGETTGDWLNGDIHFGFNMVRTFKLKGRRY